MPVPAASVSGGDTGKERSSVFVCRKERESMREREKVCRRERQCGAWKERFGPESA